METDHALVVLERIQGYLDDLKSPLLADTAELLLQYQELKDLPLTMMSAHQAQEYDDRAKLHNEAADQRYEDVCTLLHQWHRKATASRDSCKVPRDDSRRLIADYDAKIRREAEEEARKQEHAARMLAEQQRQAELKALRENGHHDDAVALAASPVVNVVVPPVVKGKLDGVSVAEKKVGVVKDRQLLLAFCARNPMHADCFALDQGAVDRKVRAGVELPGVEVSTVRTATNRHR